ncbi:MAG: Trp repressor protein [Microgenomates bacterium OLB22]|nr:MAG: Trp repressor protein [Microgenomates bacterium OLB22]
MNWDSEQKKLLVEAVLSLKTAKEAQSFCRDLLTPQEIEEFAKRLEAAALLSAKTSYLTIEKRTGLSSTTIARVSKFLNGPENGYRTVLKRIHHHTSPPMRSGLS